MALLSLLTACADRLANAENIAEQAGFAHVEIVAPPFLLTAFTHFRDASSPIAVYIEGDGAAWVTPSEPPLDPTPKRALALQLAALDTSPNVIYLARPCQFTEHDAACQETDWTTGRFSERVVASMNEAIDALVSGRAKSKITLIGYSGGGAVAVLIAARRHDVVALRTVAGNLDPTALGRYHNVSQLDSSLDPMQVASELRRLPQEHFVGGQDEVVPPFISQNFVEALGDQSCAKIVTINQATHENGWTDIWSGLVGSGSDCTPALN